MPLSGLFCCQYAANSIIKHRFFTMLDDAFYDAFLYHFYVNIFISSAVYTVVSIYLNEIKVIRIKVSQFKINSSD